MANGNNTRSIIEFCPPDMPSLIEFKRLLQRLRKSHNNGELKTILITSAVLSEGKSTICSMLGIAAAFNGMNTLVIDADMRRPSIHKLFALERKRGTSEILTEGIPPKEVIKASSMERLDVITAGKYCYPIEDFFKPSEFGAMLNGLKFYYDLILIDSPPVIPVSDPMLIAPETDGALLVIKAGETQRTLAARAVDIINTNEKKLIGTILNNMSGNLPKQYDSNRYEYSYTPDKEDG